MRRFTWLIVSLLIAGCGGSGGEKAATPNDSTNAAAGEVAPAPQVAPAVPVELATRAVTCGCAIDSIGVCGNYIDIDGHYLKIANWADLGLGAMEWCGKSGVTAESSGELRDGKFFAATLVVRGGE